MRDARTDCPHCGRQMQPGYLLERGHHDRLGGTQWVEGAPERSVWAGLKVKNRRVLPVVTYRCESCGYLASFARPADAT